MNIAQEAKDILEYALEKGEGNVRGHLLGWYSDESKALWGVRPMLDNMPYSLAYIAVEIAQVQYLLNDSIKRAEDERRAIERMEAQDQAEHEHAVKKAMAKSEGWTIGELI